MAQSLDAPIRVKTITVPSESGGETVHPGYRSGSLYPVTPAGIFSNSTGGNASGKLSFVLFPIAKEVSIAKFWILPRNAGSLMTIGIYEVENGEPTNLIHNLPETTTTSTNQSIEFNQTLTKGFYAFAYCLSTRINFVNGRYSGELAWYQGQPELVANAPQRRLDANFTYNSTLPATAPIVTTSGNDPIMIYMEVS